MRTFYTNKPTNANFIYRIQKHIAKMGKMWQNIWRTQE